MRIYDRRYDRERLRFHVALRLIRLEARTHTIRAWTGLTDDRIRKLYRSYLADAPERAPVRHRGKSPQKVALLLRSTRMRHEAALLASLCRMLGALPARAGAAGPGAALRSPLRAELLCQAYEVYRGLVTEPLLGFEQAVCLLESLARGDEVTCGTCRDCRAVVIVDRWALRSARCALCSAEAAALDDDAAPADSAAMARVDAAPADAAAAGVGA